MTLAQWRLAAIIGWATAVAITILNTILSAR